MASRGDAEEDVNIGLIDVDGHNYPNLCLMKISAWHKARGDNVEMWFGLKQYDRVYMSKVFDEAYSPEIPWTIRANEIIKGGTGYGLTGELPDYIEHIMPDYSLYGIKNRAFGFLTRGCPRNCDFCIVTQKEGNRSHKVADLTEWWGGQHYIELLDPNILACQEWPDLFGQLEESGAVINYSQGLDVRLMTEEKAAAIARTKYNGIHFAWDRMEDEKAVKRGLNLFMEHSVKRFSGSRYAATVYVLVNFDTTPEEDAARIYWLRDNGFDPFVMVYDRTHAPRETKRLANWCNRKVIFRACERFEDYTRGRTKGETYEEATKPVSGL